MDVTNPLQVESNEAKMEALERLWHPFMIISRAMGIFPFVLESREGCARPWWKNLWNFCSVLALFVFFTHLGTTVASKVANEWSITILDVDFLSVTVFPLHLIASTISFVYFLNFTSYLNDMRHLWSSIIVEQDVATRIAGQVKRKMNWAILMCTVALLQAIYVLGAEVFRIYNDNLPVVNVLNEVPLALGIIVHVIQTGLFCTLCWTINCLLDGICQDMDCKVAKENVGIHLKLFKEMYTSVIDFIQASNQLFGIYVGFLVTSSLLQACVDSYTIVVHTNIHKNIIGIVIWIIYSLLITVVVCLSAGNISDQTKRPYRILLNIDLSKCTSFQQNEALVLLDCVKSLDANISMFRIMPITMQTLPTIISIYFSYMFLLFQLPAGSVMGSTMANVRNDSIGDK